MVHTEQALMDLGETVSLLQKALPHILDQRPVMLAYLYGSVARGRVTALSDVDIALVLEQSLAPLARLDLELDIEVALSTVGIPEVDVRVINQAPPALRGRVVTEGCLLYSRDEGKRVAFEAEARSRYFDLLPMLHDQCQAYIRSALADLQARGAHDD